MAWPNRKPGLPEAWEDRLSDLLDGMFRALWDPPLRPRIEAPNLGSAADTHFWLALADELDLRPETDRDGLVHLDGARDGVRLQAVPMHGAGRQGAPPMRLIATGRATEFRVISAVDAPSGRRRTGDPTFDATCACYGDPVAITASLSAGARAHLVTLVQRGGTFDRGAASLVLPVPLVGPHAAPDALEAVLGAATQIDHAPSARIDRLLAIAASDPSPGVRARALHAAANGDPDGERVAAALAQARADREPLRLLAALLHVGELDQAVSLLRARPLPAMVELAVDTATDAQLLPLLKEASAHRDLRALHSVATGALRLPVRARLPVLASLAEHTRDATEEDGVTAAVGALLASTFPAPDAPPLDDPEFDRAMLAFVGHPIEALVLGALRTLGEHGTWRAIPLLRAAAPNVPRRVARRLEAAASAIQARVGDVGPGRVSLAEPDARGRVTLHPPEGDR